ncbi:hypothetical protein ACP4OV_016600 [Aristida adscensionis]
MNPPPRPPSPALPLLVFDCGRKYRDPHALYSIARRHQTDAAIALLLNFRNFETPLGWVLALHTPSLCTFLWRPRDGQTIDLPSAEADLPANCKCLLTHKLPFTRGGDAANPCVAVVFDLDGFQYWFCRVRGGTEWQRRAYTLRDVGTRRRPNMARDVGVAAVGGKIYYELGEHELGVLEFDPVHAEPTLTRIKVDMVRVPRGFPTRLRHFVESCGELFLVIVYFRLNCRRKVARVALYKMDFSVPAWCKVDRIGDQVFLLGGDRSGLSRFGASCSASDRGLAADRIYFFNHISHRQNTLHVFNLTNKTEEVLTPFNIPLSPMRPPFWMLPTEDPNISVQSKSSSVHS